jgi:polar amino acid transport system ATP-binding protein
MTLEGIDGGEVFLDGEPVFHMDKGGVRVAASEAHLRRMRRKVGMVFQHFHLFPHMTVLRNVTEAPRRVLGLDRHAAEERAMTLLNQVGLGEKARDYPGSLSGGQKQRVAIARALAMEPEVMLFDEVTSALDPELVGDVLGVMVDLAREGGVTMIVVTHQMRFARQVADRVLFIDEGRIVEEAPPDRMFSEPSSPRTQKFLESILDP